MKKGALATTAVALGAGATAGTGAAQEDGGGDSESVVVFADDYFPGVEFTVASQTDEGTKNDVFEAAELEDEFSDPDDWDVYLITYDLGGSAPTLGYLMTDEASFNAGDSDTMGTDGSFRNAELNLVEATLGAQAENGEPAEEEEGNGGGPEEEGNGGGPEEEGNGGGGPEEEGNGGGGPEEGGN